MPNREGGVGHAQPQHIVTYRAKLRGYLSLLGTADHTVLIEVVFAFHVFVMLAHHTRIMIFKVATCWRENDD